ERQLAHENQLKNGLVERLNKLLTKTQERQNSLINLRRLKLGREPDERYFGAMAKQVNNAIKGLTELAEENKTLVGQISTSNEFATLVDQLEAKVTEQLKTSQQYSDTTQLEKLLETSWQAEAIAELTEVITQADQDLAKVKNKLDELAPADENLAKFRELEGKLEQALTQGHDLIETPTNPDEFSAVGEEIEEDTAELRAELIALSKQPELPAETKAQKIVVKTATTEIAKANQEEQSLVETSGQDDQNKIVAVNKAQPKFGFHPPIKTSQPEVNKPTTKADEQTETPAKNPDEFNEQLQQTQPHESEINQQLRNDLELGLKHFKTRLKASLAYFKKLEVYNKDWAANWYERIKTATDQPIIAGEKITLKQLLTDSPDLNTNQLQFAQLAVSNQGQLALLLKEMESYLENHPLKVYDERRQELQSLFGKVGQRERLTKSRQVQLNTLKQKDVTGKPAEIATYGQKLIELDNQLSKASELLSKLKKEVNDLKDFEVTNPRFATLFNNLNERLDQVAVPELTLPAVTTDKITNSESLGKPNLAQQRSSVEKLIE
ncbi:hypothetical protein KC644_02785, partial [Candidatus Berkelbacteria bacterium]|nr:hypothetical protein [Candidatus Berkelbacteria bacterium]